MQLQHTDTAVVLVTHNGAEYLLRQLDSIIGQHWLPDALYLVDDASCDQSAALVRSCLRESGITLHAVPTGLERPRDTYSRIAQNFARGLAMAARTHRYIALSDQDDVWAPSRIHHQRARLMRTNALATVGDARIIDASGALTGATLRDHFPVPPEWEHAGAPARLSALLAAPIAAGAAMMIDRRLALRGLPVPWGWLHDRWLSLVAAAAGGLDIDQEFVVDYRVRPGQAVGLRREGTSRKRSVQLALARPFLTARKVRDLNSRLKQVASTESIAATLGFRKIAEVYLAQRMS